MNPAELIRAEAEKLKPPTEPADLLAQFVGWCKANGLNVFEQNLKGKNFKKFREEISLLYLEVFCRAERLALLAKSWPEPVGIADVDWDMDETNTGWNDCLLDVTRTGIVKLRPEKIHFRGDRSMATYKQGWEEAAKLIYEDYGEILKKY